MNYNYSLEDFKTGRTINTDAKIELWNMILTRTFGKVECAISTYEKHYKKGTWDSYKLNGMLSYLDELTGRKYGTDNNKLQIVASTLAVQFKKRFQEICYLVSNYKPTLERHFYPQKEEKKEPKLKSININRKKVHLVLSEIYSNDFTPEELSYIASNLTASAV